MDETFVVLPDGRYAIGRDRELHVDLLEDNFDVKVETFMNEGDPRHIRGLFQSGSWFIMTFYEINPEEASALLQIFDEINITDQDNVSVESRELDMDDSIGEFKKYLRNIINSDTDTPRTDSEQMNLFGGKGTRNSPEALRINPHASQSKSMWWKGAVEEDPDGRGDEYGSYEDPVNHQAVLDQNAGENLQDLPGPVNVPGQGRLQFNAHGEIQNMAQDYMNQTGMEYNPPRDYVSVNPDNAAMIAQEYENMPHAPEDPNVQAAYNALAQETLDQYNHIVENGYNFEFYPVGSDPYPNSPREAVLDLHNNNRMYVYPTEDGFGSGDEEYPNHPLMEDSGLVWNQQQADGSVIQKPVTYNDLFRAVHDFYGHAKEGLGFRADGEDNAYRQHAAMYSPLAQQALAAETRGQNSWVNYGPHGENNQSASTAETVFAPQKAGIMPDWVVDPHIHRQTTASWWKSANDLDDPFNEDWGQEEPTREEKWNQRYETTVMNQMEAMERGDLFDVIMEAGGIQTRDALREEYRGIPNTFKRRDGLPGDEMAEYLATYYPELGVQDERDLIDMLSGRYRMSSWWKGAEGIPIKSKAQQIEQAVADGSMDVEDARNQLMSLLSYASDFDYAPIVESIKNLNNAVPVQPSLFAKQAADAGDTADYLIEQVQSGVLSSDQARQEIQNQMGIIDDENEIFELRSKLLVLDQVAQASPMENPQVMQQQQEIAQQNMPPQPDMMPRQAGQVWWNGIKQSAPPHLDPNDNGTFDLRMDPGDDPNDWTPQDKNFRVGDEVIHTPTGQGGHIEETLDVDRYSVMLDDGDIVEATTDELQHEDNDSPAETHFDNDQSRFLGDDPEAQNFEDPTFATGEYIDDHIAQLQVGDKVRVCLIEEGQELFCNMMGTVTDVRGDHYEVEVEGNTDTFPRNAIELMPTNYNPHYGGNKTGWWVGAGQYAPPNTTEPDGTQNEHDEIVDEVLDDPGDAEGQYEQRITLPWLEENFPQEKLVNNLLYAYENSTEEDRTEGIEWYNSVHEQAQQFADTYGYGFEQVCAVFAALSPNLYWDTNFVQAIAFIEAHANGTANSWEEVRIWTPYSYEGKPCGYGKNNTKAWQILETGDTGLVKGEKVESFFHNFVNGPNDPDTRATVDIWATRVAFLDPLVKPNIAEDGSYQYLEKAYNTAAEQVGLTAKQFQAVVWVYYKKLHGRNRGPVDYVDRYRDYISTPFKERGAPDPSQLRERPEDRERREKGEKSMEESYETQRKNLEKERKRVDRGRRLNPPNQVSKPVNTLDRARRTRDKDNIQDYLKRRESKIWWKGYDADWWNL